ncbi:hypothetical protein Sjap_005353 [Stephania japonica]|uniref:Uncharacterized protein n=1 Tax=Stephania japonica TaxID=461633 RepID=A0AAP0PL26_9MAGN
MGYTIVWPVSASELYNPPEGVVDGERGNTVIVGIKGSGDVENRPLGAVVVKGQSIVEERLGDVGDGNGLVIRGCDASGKERIDEVP